MFGKTLRLPSAGTLNAGADCCRAFAAFQTHQLGVVHARHVGVNVDSVEQGTGELALVAGDHTRRTGAGFDRVTVIATSAWVLSENEQKICWKSQRSLRS